MNDNSFIHRSFFLNNTLFYEKFCLFSNILSVELAASEPKVLMQGKLFQRCTHSFDCNELSLGGKVHKKTDFEAWYGIHFHKNIYEIFWSKETIIWIFKIIKIKCFLSSSDTRRLLMHLFLFTNSPQRELVSTCTQSIHDRN